MAKDVWELLAAIKDGRIETIIQVSDGLGNSIGTLRPVTTATPSDNDLVVAMTRWRQRFMRFFITQFDASTDRTRIYLHNVVLGKPDRILFILYDNLGRAVGHMGLVNIENDRAELDNFLRGESGGTPDLVRFAELALLRWAILEMRIASFTANVLSFNWLVLDLHKEVGFREIVRRPLEKIVYDATVEHRVINCHEQSNVTYTYVEMHAAALDIVWV